MTYNKSFFGILFDLSKSYLKSFSDSLHRKKGQDQLY